MSSNQADVFTAKDMLALIALFLWAALSSAALATSICLTALIHHHTAWPCLIVLSGISLFVGWFKILLKVID